MDEQSDVGKKVTIQPSGNEGGTSGGSGGPNATISKGWSSYWWVIVVVAVVAFGVWVVSQFVGPRIPDPETYTCQPDQIVQDELTSRQGGEAHPLWQEEEQPVLPFFSVEGQVIITGPKSRVNEAVTDLEQQEIVLSLVRDCDISLFRRPSLVRQLLGAPDVDPAYFPFSRKEQKELVLRLYETDEASALRAIEEINDSHSAQHVFADLNYLTGILGQSQCGNPPPYPNAGEHDPGGSPLEASEHDPGGSPESLCAGCLASADKFWNQWAFEHIGIGPSSAYTPTTSTNLPTSKDVDVVVLDTSPSPFYEARKSEIEIAIDAGEFIYHDQKPRPVTWINQLGETEDFELYLTYPDPALIESMTPGAEAGGKNISDHGLFVAGLVHAVAPDSEIELVRVLNDYGCGDLQTLNETLIQLMLEKLAKPGTLRGTVFNLSLGIHKPRTIHRSHEDWMASEWEMTTDEVHQVLQSLERDRLESLHTILFMAHNQGALVAAAAGNESIQDQTLPMHLPADYPFVIGVASSGVERQRSYFSNWGDVAAPGGGTPSQAGSSSKSMSEAEQCKVTCDEALIGLFWNPPEGDNEEYESLSQPYYAYWRGTSFATPQVSGLAALMLDASSSECLIFGKKWAAPDRVYEAIRCGAPLADGVISVPSTLSSRCLP